MRIRFDDSLRVLADAVANALGEEALQKGVVLRDLFGRLAFFSAAALESSRIEQVSAVLRTALGPYARTDRILATPDDFGASDVLAETRFTVKVGSHEVQLVDRRLVGADWLKSPVSAAPLPARFVFGSIKGGVGRSTALAVAATHQARKGRRVLVVDLDLEAPGLGAILLSKDALPSFGTLDALVELALGPLDPEFLADMTGPSAVALHQGRIDVVPALGRRSLENPADVLAKIARAYGEVVHEDGPITTLRDHVRTVVDRLVELGEYDVVFVDARAGLHESTAAALLGLGAEVVLFGLDEPQTFQGYSVLFAHLARLIPSEAKRPEWIDRVSMVQGKASADATSRASFAERCRDLFESTLGRPGTTEAGLVHFPEAPFNDVPWDDTASDQDVLATAREQTMPVLSILYDNAFAGFDPLIRGDLLTDQLSLAVFGELLDAVDAAVASGEESSS